MSNFSLADPDAQLFHRYSCLAASVTLRSSVLFIDRRFVGEPFLCDVSYGFRELLCPPTVKIKARQKTSGLSMQGPGTPGSDQQP